MAATECGPAKPMERKIVWTERGSGDIEVIVRYIARRDPAAAGRIGIGIYDRE
jgi:plasmid stabilization system protein ParE